MLSLLSGATVTGVTSLRRYGSSLNRLTATEASKRQRRAHAQPVMKKSTTLVMPIDSVAGLTVAACSVK